MDWLVNKLFGGYFREAVRDELRMASTQAMFEERIPDWEAEDIKKQINQLVLRIDDLDAKPRGEITRLEIHPGYTEKRC